MEQKYGHLSGDELLQVLTEQNVLAQLNNIRTHPSVAAGLAKDTLKLHGWVYDIGKGDVTAFDPASERFVPLRHINAAIPAGR